MKVVLDTMIWVSYCSLKDGYHHRLIERARRKRVRFFVSEYILDEVTATLTEDLELSDRFAAMARRAILRIAKQVKLAAKSARFIPGDKDDDPIVQTALAAKADFRVTADKEILKSGKIQDIQIVTAQHWEDAMS